MSDFDGYFEQTGKNTGYIIHPEEILADNFAMLAGGKSDNEGTNVIKNLRKLLKEFASQKK